MLPKLGMRFSLSNHKIVNGIWLRNFCVKLPLTHVIIPLLHCCTSYFCNIISKEVKVRKTSWRFLHLFFVKTVVINEAIKIQNIFTFCPKFIWNIGLRLMKPICILLLHKEMIRENAIFQILNINIICKHVPSFKAESRLHHYYLKKKRSKSLV